MASLKDIAKEVGVSISVVSRALNDHPDQQVSPVTKKKVEEAARRLNYQRNYTASMLARGKSTAIGIFLPCHQALISDLVFGASQAISERNFQGNFFFGLSMEDYLRFLNSVNNCGSSGILTYYPENLSTEFEAWTTEIKRYQERNGKVMVLNPRNEPLDGTMEMSIDDIEGGKIAAKYLIDTNCSEFILVPPSFKSTYFNFRRKGFESVMKERGKKNRIVQAEGEDFQKLLKEIKKSPEKIFGFSAFSDYHAMSLIQEFSRNGLGDRIGKTIRIIGYDNIHAAKFTPPALTTISQPIFQLAYRAMHRLISAIIGEPLPDEELQLKPELVVRES